MHWVGVWAFSKRAILRFDNETSRWLFGLFHVRNIRPPSNPFLKCNSFSRGLANFSHVSRINQSNSHFWLSTSFYAMLTLALSLNPRNHRLESHTRNSFTSRNCKTEAGFGEDGEGARSANRARPW